MGKLMYLSPDQSVSLQWLVLVYVMRDAKIHEEDLVRAQVAMKKRETATNVAMQTLAGGWSVPCLKYGRRGRPHWTQFYLDPSGESFCWTSKLKAKLSLGGSGANAGAESQETNESSRDGKKGRSRTGSGGVSELVDITKKLVHTSKARKGKRRAIAFADILEIRMGHNTPVFEATKTKVQKQAAGFNKTHLGHEDLCFSIITSERTLDLQCTDLTQKEWLCSSLSALQQKYRAKPPAALSGSNDTSSSSSTNDSSSRASRISFLSPSSLQARGAKQSNTAQAAQQTSANNNHSNDLSPIAAAGVTLSSVYETEPLELKLLKKIQGTDGILKHGRKGKPHLTRLSINKFGELHWEGKKLLQNSDGKSPGILSRKKFQSQSNDKDAKNKKRNRAGSANVPVKCISLLDIKVIRHGHVAKSPVFRRSMRDYPQLYSTLRDTWSDCCLSIVTSERTLDLQLATASEARWMQVALSALRHACFEQLYLMSIRTSLLEQTHVDTMHQNIVKRDREQQRRRNYRRRSQTDEDSLSKMSLSPRVVRPSFDPTADGGARRLRRQNAVGRGKGARSLTSSRRDRVASIG